jgi:Tol biopolymer transport system component
VPNLADQSKGHCTFACHQALFSPDNSKVAYTGGDHRSVWVINADGTNPIQIPKTNSQDHQHFPWWLPDGQLAYIIETITNVEAYTDAFVITLPNGTPQLLQPRMQHQGPFEWLPDTSRVFFHSPRAGNFDIYTVDLTTPAGIEALQGLKDASSTPGDVHPTELPGGPGAARPGAAAPTSPPPSSSGGQPVVAPTSAPAAPAPEPQRATQDSPLWPVFIAGLLGLMALLVLIAGALIVFGRRGRRST